MHPDLVKYLPKGEFSIYDAWHLLNRHAGYEVCKQRVRWWLYQQDCAGLIRKAGRGRWAR